MRGVRLPLDEICSSSSPESLARLAIAIRGARELSNDGAVRSFIGVVNELETVTSLVLRHNLLPGADLAVSDMSQLDTYRQD